MKRRNGEDYVSEAIGSFVEGRGSRKAGPASIGGKEISLSRYRDHWEASEYGGRKEDG